MKVLTVEIKCHQFEAEQKGSLKATAGTLLRDTTRRDSRRTVCRSEKTTTMSSAECLRQFVSDRLAAAAEEIFGVLEKTVVQYEEELGRHRRLFNIAWKPVVKLHRTGGYSLCFS